MLPPNSPSGAPSLGHPPSNPGNSCRSRKHEQRWNSSTGCEFMSATCPLSKLPVHAQTCLYGGKRGFCCCEEALRAAWDTAAVLTLLHSHACKYTRTTRNRGAAYNVLLALKDAGSLFYFLWLELHQFQL